MATHCFTADLSFHRNSARPESFFRRLLWKNSGILCLATLITLPIIVGVAIGYVIVLAIVTSYRKITGQKSREEKECEAKKKIRVVLGHDLLDSAFTKPVKLPGQKKFVRPMPHYGSINELSSVTISSDAAESEESTDDEDEDKEQTEKERNVRNGTETGRDEPKEIQKEKIEREEIENVKESAVEGSKKAENDVRINETSADRDSSPAPSASSEYYSTASEMEDPSSSVEPRYGEQPDHKGYHGSKVSKDFSRNQDKPIPEIDSTTKCSSQEDEILPEINAPIVPVIPLKPRKKLNSSSENRHSTPRALGKLKYSIQYIKDKNQLQVSIIKAINLFDRTSESCPSSYVKVSLLPQRFCWQRTKVVEETRNAEYNETFVISGFSHERFAAYTLLICVIDVASQWQGYYGDHVIGEVHVPLISLTKDADNEQKGICQWVELKPKMNEIQGLSKCGKINLALCYRPISGRLIITIKKAKDLKCESKENFDPYLKLALYCDGARVGRGATRVKRRVTNPVFNEKFNFDLTSDQIAYTTIVIKVLNNIDNSACVGATVIGYESSGNGQEHWLCMMECLSQHVDAWHSLYD